MFGTEFQTAVKLYVKVTVSDAEAVLIINEAMDKISDKGYLFGEVEVNALADTWYEMPEECTSIIEVRDSDDELYHCWRSRGTLEIRFAESGTYTIVARRLADHITAADLPLVIPVHKVYHQCIVTYGRYWKKKQIDDESSDSVTLLQQFYTDIETAFRSITRKSKPVQWKVERHV
jgi:hypothetical protein